MNDIEKKTDKANKKIEDFIDGMEKYATDFELVFSYINTNMTELEEANKYLVQAAKACGDDRKYSYVKGKIQLVADNAPLFISGSEDAIEFLDQLENYYKSVLDIKDTLSKIAA